MFENGVDYKILEEQGEYFWQGLGRYETVSSSILWQREEEAITDAESYLQGFEELKQVQVSSPYRMTSYEAVKEDSANQPYVTLELINVTGAPSQRVGRFDSYEQLRHFARSQKLVDGDDIGCWCRNCMGAGELTH